MTRYWMAALLVLSGPAWAQTTTHASDAHRFHMVQNGKSMTAEDFDAWLHQRGVRVLGAQSVTQPRMTEMLTPVLVKEEPKPSAPITGVVHTNTQPVLMRTARTAAPGTIVPFGKP